MLDSDKGLWMDSWEAVGAQVNVAFVFDAVPGEFATGLITAT